MARFSGATRHMFTASFTSSILLAIAYLVLRPLAWRPQLLHILDRGFVLFTQYLGTNGPGWLVSVLGSSIFTIIATLALVGLVRGSSAMKQHWVETALIAILALVGQIVLLYGPIYLRKVTQAVFDDHVGMVGAQRELKRSIKSLTVENSNLKGENQYLKDHPKMITKNVPTISNAVTASGQEPRDCRVSELFAEPNPNIKGAMSETIVVIHCNYRIDAPLCARVEFTQDFVQGNIFLPDEGTVMGGGWKKQGKVYQGCLQSPSLPANHILTVTVEGTTKEFPRVIGGTVFSQ